MEIKAECLDKKREDRSTEETWSYFNFEFGGPAASGGIKKNLYKEKKKCAHTYL